MLKQALLVIFSLISISCTVIEPIDFEELNIGTRVVIFLEDSEPIVSWELIDLEIRIVEAIYAPINLHIIIEEIEFLNLWMPKDIQEDAQLHKETLNIYFTHIPLEMEINGWSGMPFNPYGYQVVVGQLRLPTTLAHEIGHYFGLFHTYLKTDLVEDTLPPNKWDTNPAEAHNMKYRNIMGHASIFRTYLTDGQLERVEYYARRHRKMIMRSLGPI